MEGVERINDLWKLFVCRCGSGRYDRLEIITRYILLTFFGLVGVVY